MSSRTDTLHKALLAGVTGDTVDFGDIFTDDVIGIGPNLAVASRAELETAFGEREGSFSDIGLDVTAEHEIDGRVIIEWTLTGIHSGPFTFEEDLTLEATGRPVELRGATFADFRGEQISAFRSYFDGIAVLEQLLPPDD